MDKTNNNADATKKEYSLQAYAQREYPLSPDIRQSSYTPEYSVEDFHLRDYLHIVFKRKWIVISFFISVVITTAILSFFMVPVYQSTVTIKIDNQNPDALTNPGQSAANPATDYVITQLELLKSRALAEKVVKDLNLGSSERFLPVQSKLSRAWEISIYPIKSSISAFTSLFKSEDPDANASHFSQTAQPYREEIPIYLSSALISRLQVTPVKNSQLVKISFEANDPQVSTNVANAVAKAYIEYDLESRIDANRRAQEFLEKQISDTKQKTQNTESKLNEYASRNQIIFLDGSKESVLTKKLTEVTSSLGTASTERINKEAIYNQIKESGTAIPEILNNTLIQGLLREHATLEAEYSNLSKTFTPDFPKMKNLKNQIDSISNRLESEKARLKQSLEADYFAALKKENYLKKSSDSLKAQVLHFQERAVEYESLKREIDVDKELHNVLLQKLNEVGIAVMSKASSIQIVDSAVYPRSPIKPNKQRNLLLSVIFGLMGGIGLAFFVEYFDDTVKDTQEIEKLVRLPSLGIIPFQTQLNPETKHLLAKSDFSNPVSEAFRSIGTFLLLSSSTNPPKTILITSPGAKEGKTTMCINIAAVLAEAVGDGIIIDADLRRPRLHNFFKLDNKNGLSKYLSGNIEFDGNDGRLIKPTSLKGISVITSGPTPPNPSELLYSAKMKDLLDALQATYKFVIIDAPPVMGMPDSILLSNLVDGTVLVVKAGETQKSALAETKKIFNSVNAKLLGVVLNGVKKNDVKYGYYSRYYSSYFVE